MPERAARVLDYLKQPPFPTTDNVYLTGMRKNCDMAIYIDVLKAISGKSYWLNPYQWVKRLVSVKKKTVTYPTSHSISDGIRFFWSENGVLLTPGDSEGKLAPCYFSRALQLKPSRKLLLFSCWISTLCKASGDNMRFNTFVLTCGPLIYLFLPMFCLCRLWTSAGVGDSWHISPRDWLQQFLTLCSG